MEVWNKEKLRRGVQVFVGRLDEAQLDIMFVRKVQSAAKYKTYMLEARNRDMEDMVKNSLKNILGALDKRDIGEYDLELSQDDFIQYVPSSTVMHSATLLSQIGVELNEENTLNENVAFDKLDFIVIQIFIPDIEHGKITILKKHIKNSVNLRKNAMKIAFVGKEYRVLDNNILSIGDNVEALLIGDNYYILNRNAFNSMLDYKDVFKRIVSENAQAIKDADIFTDAEGFVEQCKSDGRYLPRLTKAIIHNGFGNLVTYKTNVRSIKDDYGLTIKLTNDNKIVYEKPEDIPEILNLLLEHYVTSALTDNRMLAKAIEIYSISS